MCRPACAPETGPHTSATACCAEMPVGWPRTRPKWARAVGSPARRAGPHVCPLMERCSGALPSSVHVRCRARVRLECGACARGQEGLRRVPASRCQDAGCGMRAEWTPASGDAARGRGRVPGARCREQSLRLGSGRSDRPNRKGRYGWPGPGEEAAVVGPGRNGLRCAAERAAHSTTWSPPQRATGTGDGAHGPGPEARRRRCARAPVTHRVWKQTSLRAPPEDRSHQ